MIAGVSVGLVAVPQSLAYAELAGMPPVQGLYAAALPPIVAAFVASSPYLQTGPVAVTSLLTFGALSSLAPPGSDEYVALGLMLALVVALVRVALGLARAGVVAYIMSEPMLVGFVPAAALLIAGSQLARSLGSGAPDYDNAAAMGAWAVLHPGTWELAAVALSGMVLLVIFGGRRLHALFPGVILAALLGLAATLVFGYGGTTIENIPSGLPPLTVDNLDLGRLPEVLVAGVVIALVGFSESAAIARRFAAEDRTHWSANREFFSQGLANLTSAASGGFPCGGSFSRSSLMRLAGANSRLAGGISGITVLAFLPIAFVLEPLPSAVLGAIVIAAVVGLMRFRPLFDMWRYSRPQAFIAWFTLVATLASAPHIERAVVAGVALSFVVLLWRLLALDVDIEENQGELVITPHGVLWFASSQKLSDAVLTALAEHPAAKRLKIDLAGIGRLDTTAALALRTILEDARRAGLVADLYAVPPQSRELAERVIAGATDQSVT